MTGIVFYNDTFIREGFAGITVGPIICIRRDYKDDIGLLVHEQTHVAQWLRNPIVHSVMYLCSKKYRLAAEVEAYKAQMACYPDDRSGRFAEFIATKYGLNISKEEARKLLTTA